ncbi:MAG TPA: 50S ribosomal protein L31e [Candidatus Nitrosocosmicus sp.]
MSNVEETVARIYTINFSKAWLTPKYRRTDRVVNMIKEFAMQHMKSSEIKIDQELNRYIWEKGKTNPPRKVRVRIVKDEDDQVIVSLYEDILNESLSSANAGDMSTELKDDNSIKVDDDVDTTSSGDAVNDSTKNKKSKSKK